MIFHSGTRALAQAEPDETPQETSQSDAEEEGLPYSVTLEGPLEPELAAQLEAASLLVRENQRLPRTVAALHRRIREDRELLKRVLKSNGFYAPKITIRSDDSAEELAVIVTVDPGVLYLIGDYQITYGQAIDTAQSDRPLPQDLEDLKLYLGEPAKAQTFLTAEQRLIAELNDRGYPKPRLTPLYRVDHEQTLILAQIDVFPGPFTHFGPLRISGLETVSPSYVARLADWQEGKVFSQARMEDLRADLRDANLFSKVALSLDETALESGVTDNVPVTVELVERKHKIISATLGATTGEEKIFGKLGWENRNFWGEGETVKLEGVASFVQQSGKVYFNKPNYHRLNQSLQASAELRHEDSKALTERAAGAYVGLERLLWKNWIGSAGVAGEYSLQENEGTDENYTLAGLPFMLGYDSRNDLLDPSKGQVLTLHATPWVNFYGEKVSFMRNEAEYATYWDLQDNRETILAVRARLGSLAFSSNKDIPPNKRFYAGGGGSVRGYEFRSLGELDSNNDPVGGSSVAEVSTEVRQRIGEDFGLVGFIDGGQVYADPTPQLSNSFQWAAGLGVRYYTIAGPVRADLAFPLNPRESDKSFQFYISLGQAF